MLPATRAHVRFVLLAFVLPWQQRLFPEDVAAKQLPNARQETKGSALGAHIRSV
jgi:hypothetical protein